MANLEPSGPYHLTEKYGDGYSVSLCGVQHVYPCPFMLVGVHIRYYSYRDVCLDCKSILPVVLLGQDL